MSGFAATLGDALLMAIGMFWEVGWSLALGFIISALLQVFVSKERMQKALGRDGAKEIALATLYGAASSSCSYASASISRTLFKKGAALTPSLAFLLASTNLVVELGIVLYLLMGWQFTLAEWLGGVVLVIIMALLVKLTYPAKLVFEARHHPDEGMMHVHEAPPEETFHARLRDPRTRILVAQIFSADFLMLWKDLAAGFLIAGFLAAFVPAEWWEKLFLTHAAGWIQVPANAVIGVLIAVFSFVCSIGNAPMAAVLWGSGIGFGGVLAFLYADLIVLPLLDVYRRYYGWKMAAYIASVFFVTMILAALLMDAIFTSLGFVPGPSPDIRAEMTHFALNYTFVLNIVFGALAAWLFILARRQPMPAHHHKDCCH
jgi:uncharacterized membrane protein YraQ (UPF0718 family)